MTPRLGHRRGGRSAGGPEAGRDAGSVLVMVAISLTVIVTCTALTVDLGRVSLARRDLQNVADAAALDLVRLVDGRTAGEITADPRWAEVRDASLARNGFAVGGDATVAVLLGAHDATTEVFTPVAAADEVPSAVQVVVGDRVEHAFAPGGTSTTRRAVGAQTASTGIRLGASGALLDAQEVGLAAALVGDALDVTPSGVDALAGAPVGVDALVTGLGLSLAGPAAVRDAEPSIASLLDAAASALRAEGRVAEADVLDALVAALPDPDASVALSRILVLDAGGADAAAGASIDALDLLVAAALAAHPTGTPLVVAGLDLGVGGLAAGDVRATIVAAPRIAFGGTGARAEAGEVEVEVEVGLVAPGLVGATVTLTVSVDPSVAVVRSVSCGEPQGLATDATSAEAEAGLVVAGAVEVPGDGVVAEVSGAATTSRGAAVGAVDFTLPPDALGVGRPVPVADLDVAGLAVPAGWAFLPGLPIAEADLDAGVRPQVQGIVDGTLAPLLAQASAALDARLVQPLLSLLGLSAPGAEVTPLALRCSGARLVA